VADSIEVVVSYCLEELEEQRREEMNRLTEQIRGQEAAHNAWVGALLSGDLKVADKH
jgi:hypothetical protein